MGAAFELLTEWLVPATIVLIVEAALYKLYCRWKVRGADVFVGSSPRVDMIRNVPESERTGRTELSESKSVRADPKMAPVCVDFNSLSRVSSIETAADISSRTTSNSCSHDGTAQESRVYTPRTVLSTLSVMKTEQLLTPPAYGSFSAVRRLASLPNVGVKTKSSSTTSEKRLTSLPEQVTEEGECERHEDSRKADAVVAVEEPSVSCALTTSLDKAEEERRALLEERHRKANSEAFFLLQRALKFRQIDVAKTVLRDFQREGVPINPGVFALLVQVALSAKDYAVSSEWLSQLMAFHKHVDPAWLDRVFAATSVGSPSAFATLLENLSQLPQMSEACKVVLERAQVYLDAALRKSGVSGASSSSSASATAAEITRESDSCSVGARFESSSATKMSLSVSAGEGRSAMTSKAESAALRLASQLSVCHSSSSPDSDAGDGASLVGTEPSSFEGVSSSPCSTGTSTNLNPNAPEFVPSGMGAVAAPSPPSSSGPVLHQLLQCQALLHRAPLAASPKAEEEAALCDASSLLRLESGDPHQRLLLLESLLCLLQKAGASEPVHSQTSFLDARQAGVSTTRGATESTDSSAAKTLLSQTPPFRQPATSSSPSSEEEEQRASVSSEKVEAEQEAVGNPTSAGGGAFPTAPSLSADSSSSAAQQQREASAALASRREGSPQGKKSRQLIVQALLSNMRSSGEQPRQFAAKTSQGSAEGSRLTPLPRAPASKAQTASHKEGGKNAFFRRRPPLPPKTSGERATRIVDTP